MSALIRRLRALAPSREQLEANPWLRRLAPHLANPKLWCWSRRGVALGVAIGLFIGFLIPVAQILLAAAAAVVLRANVPIAAAASYLLISRVWIWHVAAKRRGVRPIDK